jgi:uncharacterized repeat protein (TIGR02543 family)
VRPGYSFVGWDTKANGNGTVYVAGETFTMGSSNVTLYAKWTADVTPPTINSTNPVRDFTGVALDASITATFSEAMNGSTITSTSFTLMNGSTSTPVTGTVSYDAGTMTATFAPDSPLESGMSYTATITTGVTDLAGNALASDFVWSFTTTQ